MTLSEKNVFTIFLLSLITFGIYYLYWIYTTSTALTIQQDIQRKPALELCLGILTLGIYFVYWHYRTAKEVFQLALSQGYFGIADHSLLCALCAVFPLGNYLSMGLIQDKINTITLLSERN